MKKADKKQSSILMKIILPMTFVIAIQAALFMGLFLFGGMSESLDSNTYEILNERVLGRKKELDTAIIQWTAIDALVDEVQKNFNAYMSESKIDYSGFSYSDDKKKDFLSESSDLLVDTLRKNKVNGIYMIFTGDEDNSKVGLNIRDLDPYAGDENDNDLIIEKGPVSVVKKLGYSLSSSWQANYSFSDKEYSDYYSKPISAALDNPDAGYKSLSYWSKPYSLEDSKTETVSYSVPLMDKNKNVFAVLGIEISVGNIMTHLAETKISSAGVYYVVALQNEQNMLVPIIYDDSNLKRLFGAEMNIKLDDNSNNVNFISGTDGPVVSSIKPVVLYGSNAVYGNNKIVLAGMAYQDELLKFNNGLRRSMVLLVLITFALSIVVVYIMSYRVSHPIKLLYDKVKRINPRKNFHLGRVNIKEIDRLIDSIEELNINAKDYENRISEIIRLSDLPIGTFEIERDTGASFISDEFVKIMSKCLKSVGITRYYEGKLFDVNKDALMPYAETVDSYDHSAVFHFTQVRGEEKWIKCKISYSGNRIIGFAMDITAERMEQAKIEYERDHDVLTDLYNRRAFHQHLNRLFKNPEQIKTAVMIMMDVDNLKYVNDTFGHNYGDIYLRAAASILRKYEDPNTLVSRISGDEFIIFSYNSTENKVMDLVDSLKADIYSSSINLPGQNEYKIRLSAGYSIYPIDTLDSNELIKFADFAMFQIKHNKKGDFKRFDRDSYRQTGYIMESGDEVIRLIENGQIEYYLQPIVDVENEEIHGYEALMRPQSRIISTPFELLAMAKAQGRLYQIERYTWLEVLSKFQDYRNTSMYGKKIFINSIPNQLMSDFDYDQISARYGDILKDVVVEITEEERSDSKYTDRITDKVKSWGGMIAIDDYGSGFNGQTLLLELKVNYVKIDMKIIRGIEKDVDRQLLVKNLVDFCKGKNINIIAEGIETPSELKCVMDMGIRFIQGYLLGMPADTPAKLTEAQLNIIKEAKQ